MQDNERSQYFFELFEGAPRQGPGNFDATKQALNLCRGLPEKPRILDIGCGVGVQTLALAELTRGEIDAVDINQPMLKRLRAKIEDLKLATRIRVHHGDMKDLAALQLPLEGYDLIWSEGAIFIMGFENGLRAWRPYLRPGACLAVSDLVWLRPDAPEECRAYILQLVPDLDDREAQRRIAREAGYEILGDFALSKECWTTHFYVPICECIPAMRKKYPDNPECAAVLKDIRIEAEMHEKYGEFYGYQFLILRRLK